MAPYTGEDVLIAADRIGDIRRVTLAQLRPQCGQVGDVPGAELGNQPGGLAEGECPAELTQGRVREPRRGAPGSWR